MTPRPSRQFLLAFPLALLLAAAPATAQDASYPRVGVGVGVSVSNASPSTSLPAGEEAVPLPTPSLLIPIDVSETFRIEPVLGYSRITTSREIDAPDDDLNEETSTTLTSLRIGVGWSWLNGFRIFYIQLYSVVSLCPRGQQHAGSPLSVPLP